MSPTSTTCNSEHSSRNDVNVVTISLTQIYWHKDCVDYRGKTSSNPLWTLGGTTKDLETWLDQTNTQCDGGKCILLKDSKEWHDSWKWIVMEISLIPNWLEMIWRQVPCSKVTTNCHLFAKWFPSLNSPSWLMSVSFLFYEFKEGNKNSLYLILG